MAHRPHVPFASLLPSRFGFLILFIFFGWTWPNAVLAAGAGTSTLGFLKLGAGARAESMGGAYGAVARDASAVYWNPAGLARQKSRNAILMHATHIDDSSYDFLAYGQRTATGGLGVGLQYFSAGSVNRLDESAQAIGSFTPSDLALTGGYGCRVKKWGVGATGKYIRSKLLNTASTYAIDLGVQSPLTFNNRLRFSGGIANLGKGVQYSSKTSELPQQIRLGSALAVMNNWGVALDVIRPKEGDTVVALGSEVQRSFQKGFSLAFRAGYNSQSAGDGNGFSGGFGFILNKLSVDYGLVSLGDFDLSHRVSLQYNF